MEKFSEGRKQKDTHRQTIFFIVVIKIRVIL